MYIAQRELKVSDRQNNVKIFKPGDEVIGFETWDLNARRAHLNLEWVTEVSVREPKKRLTAPSPLKIGCSKCSKEFKNPKALKTHTTIAHK